MINKRGKKGITKISKEIEEIMSIIEENKYHELRTIIVTYLPTTKHIRGQVNISYAHYSQNKGEENVILLKE